MLTPTSTARAVRTAWTGLGWGRRGAAVLAVVCSLLGACHRAPPAGADASTPEPKPASGPKSTEAARAGTPESAAEGAKEGVTLTPEQIEKLGLVTEVVRATEYSEHASGYGVVISHETIAQAVAELATARATELLSHSALRRARELSGTPGAVSADVEEIAAQKAAIDAAALTLTTERLSSTLGMNPPWAAARPGRHAARACTGQNQIVACDTSAGLIERRHSAEPARGALGHHPTGFGLETECGMGCAGRCQHTGAELFCLAQRHRRR